MPHLWKRPPHPSAGLSRLVSGLRHDGGGSSLVVQTGFPTSLADLVVKNRDRLKKPSRRKKRSSELNSSAGYDDAAAAAASPVSEFGPSPSPREDRRCRRGAPAVPDNSAVPGTDGVRRPAPAGAGPTERRGFGLPWSGLLTVSLFVLAVPAMDRRKLAAGITLAAFGLWILDAIGVRVFPFLPPCADATRSSESASAAVDLERRALVSPTGELGNKGLASPVREVGGGGSSSPRSIVASERSKRSSDSIEASNQVKSSSDLIESPEKGESSSDLIGEYQWNKSCPDLVTESEQRVVDSIDLNQEKKVSWKRRDLGALAKVCAARLAGSSSNSKAKKLLVKFLPKKLRRKSKGNAVSAFALDLSSGEIPNNIMEQEDEAIEGDGNSTDDVMSFIASDSVSNCGVENVEVVQERVQGAWCISSQHMACLAIILVGLLGGKALALVLTVTLIFFGKSTESLWKKKMDSVV